MFERVVLKDDSRNQLRVTWLARKVVSPPPAASLLLQGVEQSLRRQIVEHLFQTLECRQLLDIVQENSKCKFLWIARVSPYKVVC